MKVIIITGTPASGKTTIAEKAAKRINAQVIHANDIVRSKHLFSSYAPDGAMVARLGKLRSEIEKEIKRSKSNVVIIEGHLLCEISIKNAIAIVVREHLKKLENRMKKRRYSSAKIKENIVSEATDYCGINAQKHYAQVFEIMNDSRAVTKVIMLIRGTRNKGKGIELLQELADFTKRRRWNA